MSTSTTALPATFSGVVIDRSGPLRDVLQLSKDLTLAPPTPTQVTVRVIAAAANPVDWKIATGLFAPYGLPKAFPHYVGFDLSGVVVQVGSAVTRLTVGDEVYADGFTQAGAFSEFTNVEAEEVSLKPHSISFAEAAAIPLAAETSLTSLEKAGIKRGSRVVVIGGAGGTGMYAVQIAKALGAAEVVAVVSSRHVEYVKSIGADVVVDYTQTSLAESGVKDVDVVYDTVGGHWEDAQKVLADTGKFVTIAFWEPAPASKQYTSHLLTSSHKHLDRITEWVNSGKIKTYIEKEFPFTQDGVRDMYEYSQAGKTRGKVVLKIAP
jgi:NADPH:quinone reductase-like Zn-dependent oxidoreductase